MNGYWTAYLHKEGLPRKDAFQLRYNIFSKQEEFSLSLSIGRNEVLTTVVSLTETTG